MSIMRRHKTRDFSIMSNEIFRNTEISARAKGVYSYIMTLPDDWKIHKTELPKHFLEGKSAIFKAFEELVKYGYIVVIIDSEKGLKRVSYDVYETSQNKETTSSDFRKPENQNAANQQLLSTNKQITDNTKDTTSESEPYSHSDFMSDMNKFIKDFNALHGTSFSTWRSVTDSRRKKVSTRRSEGLAISEVISNLKRSVGWLKGFRGFSIDWVVENETNWVKIVEGKFLDKTTQQPKPKSMSDAYLEALD